MRYNRIMVDINDCEDPDIDDRSDKPWPPDQDCPGCDKHVDGAAPVHMPCYGVEVEDDHHHP